jgi:hypothetical protein
MRTCRKRHIHLIYKTTQDSYYFLMADAQPASIILYLLNQNEKTLKEFFAVSVFEARNGVTFGTSI